MIGGGVIVRLPLLCHHVADIYFLGRGLLNRFGQVLDQQIGQNAGIQRAWTDHDRVRAFDRFQRFRQRVEVVRMHFDALDLLVGERNLRLALNEGAVREERAEDDRFPHGGQDAPGDRKDAGRFLQRRLKIAGHVGHCGDEQVAEGMTGETLTGGKAVLPELLAPLADHAWRTPPQRWGSRCLHG